MDSETQSMQAQYLAVPTTLSSLSTCKENESCYIEEPPAYSTATQSTIIDNIATYFARQTVAHDIGDQTLESIPYSQLPDTGAMTEDSHDELSPISLRISTHINVACDGNLVVLPCSPSEQANSIAKADVETIQGKDWATGLPMIDESGRPRPLKLDIDAGITIKGSSNVIGTASLMEKIVHGRTQEKRQTAPCVCRRRGSSIPTRPSSPYRRRRASELGPLDQPKSKRARSEE
ncbi:uncharacterized protein CTRU02_208693 [Colletotrichum truncatum]|uniref:Uncharacterized protein n=1 Tax=Colletotrichum truncatum TaxID=5467 RepID=A0ACC3YX08_COLTU|nr:uncharacterized protein CTRU02_06648 [Colletotrichum truncatum]KAF6792565.1 hypothetical protein CTRU02_06648 [Colletotrichum truncatum]